MKYWLLFLAWLGFVTLVIVGADQEQRHRVYAWVNAVPFGDKAGHVVLIGVLAGLLNLATQGRCVRVGRLRVHLGGALIGLIMTLEELSQIWIPNRTFDAGDLLANYLGVALAGFAWRAAHQRPWPAAALRPAPGPWLDPAVAAPGHGPGSPANGKGSGPRSLPCRRFVPGAPIRRSLPRTPSPSP